MANAHDARLGTDHTLRSRKSTTRLIATTTSNPTLDGKTSSTDVPMHAATDSEMGADVADVETEVPRLVMDKQPEVGGGRVFVNGPGSGWNSELTAAVLCSISVEEENSGNEMTLVLEPWVYDSKTGIEISREKILEGRKAEMEEMMNHHVFDKGSSE